MENINTEPRIGRHSGKAGFTIIELLVVVGLITIFLSIIGLALTRTSETAGLEASQRTISALVSGARGQAVMKQTRVYVLVSVDRDDPDSFLRTVQVATSSGILRDLAGVPILDASGNKIPILRATRDPTRLSRGVFIVPSDDDATRMGLNPGNTFGEYDDTLRQQGLPQSAIEQRRSNGTYGDVKFEDNNDRETYLYYEFSPRGFTDGYRIVFSPGERELGGIKFNQPNLSAGFLLRPLGSVTMISDPRGFDE